MNLPSPKKEEIDHRTLKLLVGVIALTLGSITSFFADSQIASISAAYYEGGWSQSLLVGFLFAIATFLVAYNGVSRVEMLLSKVAALSALGVALFPCGCGDHRETIPHVHFVSAAIMFLILAGFCYIFYKRARSKPYTEAGRRAVVYAICGVVIIASILILVFDTLAGHPLEAQIPRLVFYCERSALMAFGISWLTASRTLPILTNSNERFSLLS